MSLIYLALLSFASVFLVIKTRTAPTSHYRNIFWALASAVIMKASACITGYQAFTINLPIYQYALIDNFSTLSAVVPNIFLFHFGISIITHKVRTIIDYKVFPIVLFAGYIMLYISGVIDTAALSSTSKLSFGYNGAILGCVGCVNLYYEKRKTQEKNNALYGLLLLGLGLFTYAATEGILSLSIFPKITIDVLNILSAGMIAASSLTVTDLMKEHRGKIGFV